MDSRLRRYATAIHDLAGVDTRAIRLRAETGLQDFQARLQRGSSDTAAVILLHCDPARARAAQAVAGPPIITDLDTTAITLTAAVLTTLTRAGRTPASARVVIAGANNLPGLCPLLVAAGIGDITTWNTSDAAAFPLLGVAANADAVINLLTDQLRTAALPMLCAAHTGPTVITPNPHDDPLLVLPGLARALLDTPGVRWNPAAAGGNDPDRYAEVGLACALTLVMATPPEHTLPTTAPTTAPTAAPTGAPTRAQRQLTDRIAEAAIHALQPRTPRPDPPHRYDPPRGDAR